MLDGGVLERVGRGAGFALFTVPAVALAHLAVTGTMPPAGSMLMVALSAVLLGLFLPGRAAAGLVAAQLTGHLAVFLSLGEPSQGCLPVMGRGAELGVRIAVLRDGTSCTPGQFAIGTIPATALTLMLLAVMVVLAQLLAAGVGAALLHAASQLGTVAATLGALARSLVTSFVLALLVARRTRVLPTVPALRPSSEPSTLASRFTLSTDPQRGPPALTFA